MGTLRRAAPPAGARLPARLERETPASPAGGIAGRQTGSGGRRSSRWTAACAKPGTRSSEPPAARPTSPAPRIGARPGFRKRRIQNWPRWYGMRGSCAATAAAAASVAPPSRRAIRNSAITVIPKRRYGKRKLRQQRNRALTGPAQIAAHTDRAVKPRIHQRAAVEAMCDQRPCAPALRAVVRPITIRVGNLFGVLLDGPGEGV